MESEGETGASAPGDNCHDNSEVDEVASEKPPSLPLVRVTEFLSQLTSDPSFLRENSGLVIDNNAADFVRTKDFDDALDILKDKNVVILRGVPGSGKTTLGHALLRRLRDQKGVNRSAWKRPEAPTVRRLLRQHGEAVSN